MNIEQIPAYETEPDDNIVYHDYRYNAYYNVKQYNPMWWNMVGNGKPKEACGYMVHTEFEVCRNTQGHFNSKAENKWVLSKRAIGCNQFECPIDYVKACAYQAIKVATRFARMPQYNKYLDSGINQISVMGKDHPVRGFRTLQKKYHRKQVTSPEDRSQFGYPVHITLSPSKEWMELTKSSKDHRRLVRKLYHIIRKLGIIGGCIIYHPWRSTKETLPEGTPEHDIVNGTYDYKGVKLYCEVNGKNSNRWYISGHFHVIGYLKHETNQIDGVEVTENYEKTGMVVINHGIRKSVFATALYQLTHAGYRKHFHTLNWFGSMGASSKWFQDYAFDEPLTPVSRKCPICSQPMVKMVWIGENDPPCMGEPEGIYFVDPFKEYRIVEKLKSDVPCDGETTIEDIENAGYLYLDGDD
jgi:hypothetical protein